MNELNLFLLTSSPMFLLKPLSMLLLVTIYDKFPLKLIITLYADQIPATDLPTVLVLEQPCKSYRFRYSSEQGVVACLYGENSTLRARTFPKLKISNFNNMLWTAADVLVSCVTHDLQPGQLHPRVHPNMVMNNKRVTIALNVYVFLSMVYLSEKGSKLF